MDITVCSAIIVIEFVTTLYLTHLQKNIGNNLVIFAIVSIFSVSFDVVKSSALDSLGYSRKQDYIKKQWKKYNKLDLVSREKESVEDFTSKVSRGSYATMSQIQWGVNIVSSSIISLISFFYIVFSSGRFSIAIILIVLNVVWLKLITSLFIKKYDTKNLEFREMRKTNESLMRLYAQRIYSFEDCVSNYLECEKRIDGSSQEVFSLWQNAVTLQQLPNYFAMLTIPYMVEDVSLYPVFVLVFNNFTSAMRGLSQFMNRWTDIKRDIKSMDDFWEDKSEKSKPIQENIPEIINVSIRLSHGPQTDNLRIVKGGRYNIRGESGCGKTTLIKAILGYTDGAVFDTTENPSVYTDKTVYMRQTIRETVPVISTTVRQLFYNCADDKLIMKCLYLARATEWFESSIKSLDQKINNKISGGEKTRLCLATVIYKVITMDAQWLILDEPEQGVDPELAPEMLVGIFKEFPHLTIFIITHLCDCRIGSLGITAEWKFENNTIYQLLHNL